MFQILFDGALKGRRTSSILPLRPISKHILRYIDHTFLKIQNLVLVLDWLAHFEWLYSHNSLVWSCPSKSETSSMTANLVTSMIVFCKRGNSGFFFFCLFCSFLLMITLAILQHAYGVAFLQLCCNCLTSSIIFSVGGVLNCHLPCCLVLLRSKHSSVVTSATRVGGNDLVVCASSPEMEAQRLKNL